MGIKKKRIKWALRKSLNEAAPSNPVVEPENTVIQEKLKEVIEEPTPVPKIAKPKKSATRKATSRRKKTSSK